MITDFTIEGYIAHDFDELYELLSNAEPEFQRKTVMYEILQYDYDETGIKYCITARDLTKKKKNIMDKSTIFDVKYFPNAFELVHNYKLKEGKTIAQIICDNNGWDYSILPVYPKNFTPLFGDANKKDADGK